MNGFIRGVRQGLFVSAAIALLCWQGARDCWGGSPVGYAEHDCVDSRCCGCQADPCAARCRPVAKLKEKLRDFDYEQLHTDHCWPAQYTREAKRRVNDPFRRQLQQGASYEVTMWRHYFEDEEGHEHELNAAGMARLRYLTRRKPYVIRNLALETSFDSDLDQKRTDAIIAFANKYTFVSHPAMTEPGPWTVTLVDRAPVGLMGREAPAAISKMIGPRPGEPPVIPPFYEPQIKQSFFLTGGTSGVFGQ